MDISSDYRDLFKILNKHKVRYLVVGAYAVVYYTEPRFTKDLDICIMADPVEPVTVGLTVRNIFGKLGDGAIPVQLRAGMALKLLPEENLLLAVDLVKAFVELDDDTSVLHMGAEYWAAKLLGFRLGVTSDKEFSAGIGINISDILIDYAYSIKRDGLEPDVHYVSICASF